jgi:hypothetical protein
MRNAILICITTVMFSGCFTQKQVRVREERARVQACEEKDQTLKAYRLRLERFNQVNPDGSLRTR